MTIYIALSCLMAVAVYAAMMLPADGDDETVAFTPSYSMAEHGSFVVTALVLGLAWPLSLPGWLVIQWLDWE